MIRISKAPFAWTAPWDGAPVIMLRAGDVIERGELEAELAEMRAGRVFDFQIEAAFIAGVEALLKDSPDDVERIRDAATAAAEGQELSSEDQAMLAGARDAVKEHWPPFAALIGQAARRNELIPMVAFQRFCTGWEGAELPAFAKGMDGRVTLEAMGNISSVLLRMAGLRAYEALYATDSAGNSERLSPPDKSHSPSPSGTSKAAGSSAARTAKSGPKTRSPRAPAGRSRS
jgi:hypothetical protein